VTPLDVPPGGSGRTTSCWPSWRAADYAASGREELARFAGSRVTLRTPVGIIRDAALYLSAVDDLLRHPDDKPSIGIILCKAKNQVVAEYALRDLAKPVGVSTYITKLVESLPPALRGSLPSPKELEAELEKDAPAED